MTEAYTYFAEPALDITSHTSRNFIEPETLIDVSRTIPVPVKRHKYLFSVFRAACLSPFLSEGNL
jgi:hypothetical protein